MHLTDEDIISFQVLYKKHFGVEISTAQAVDKGLRLLCLKKTVAVYEAKKQAAQKLPQQIIN